MLCYVPAARGLILGPTYYAAARISDLTSSFEQLLTEEILQHIVAMTNLHGRCSNPDWRDVNREELQAYFGLLILANIYRSKYESTLSLWSEKSGQSNFQGTMSHKRFHHISHCVSTTTNLDPNAVMISWPSSAKFRMCGHELDSRNQIHTPSKKK